MSDADVLNPADATSGLLRYVTNQGVILPDTGMLLEEVRAEWRQAIGSDISVAPETPQGVLISAETVSRRNTLEGMAAIVNQINPELAQGVFLDALMAVSGMERRAAVKSFITAVECTGTPGTDIPYGTKFYASTMADITWTNQGLVTLDADGKGRVGVLCDTGGAIFLPSGESGINRCVDTSLELESINQVSETVIGADIETDVAARLRRIRTLATQTLGFMEAMQSNILQIEGVQGMAFLENPGNETVEIREAVLPPHSIWVCVTGGREEQVALTILELKSLGVLTANGLADGEDTSIQRTVSLTTSWDFSTQIRFCRSKSATIYIDITVGGGFGILDIEKAVRDEIIAYSLGQQDGEDGFTLGSDISSAEIASAVNRTYPSIFVQRCAVAREGGGFTDVIPMKIFEIGVTFNGAINVQVIR